MREKMKVAAENTAWRYIWLRAIYYGGPGTLEYAIFHESLMCAYYARDILAGELRENYGPMLLNHSPEWLIDKYSAEYPELCLILCNLGPFGPLSPIGLSDDFARRAAVDRVFGMTCDSPLHNVDFYSQQIPIIRIKDSIFTIGTNQPQFSTIGDVRDYFRHEARIEEIARMSMFWIRKFYS